MALKSVCACFKGKDLQWVQKYVRRDASHFEFYLLNFGVFCCASLGRRLGEDQRQDISPQIRKISWSLVVGWMPWANNAASRTSEPLQQTQLGKHVWRLRQGLCMQLAEWAQLPHSPVNRQPWGFSAVVLPLAVAVWNPSVRLNLHSSPHRWFGGSFFLKPIWSVGSSKRKWDYQQH